MSIEDAILRRLDPDELAVYADKLQAAGDPRGEIIALELQPQTEMAVALHRVLLRSWAPDLPESPRPDLKIRYGFIEHMRLDRTGNPWLASHVGDYVREVTIMAKAADVRLLLAELASRPRPWLSKLTILAGAWSTRDDVVLTDEIVTALPNLLSLDLTGCFDLRELVHPRLERLAWSVSAKQGANTMRYPLYLPAVTTVDLELNPWPPGTPAPTLEHLPVLTTLDVSRTEPPHGSLDGFKLFDVFAWLRTLAARTQLTKLRLPSIQSQQAAENLARAIEGLTCEIEVARAYLGRSFGSELGITMPETWPWPPPGATHLYSPMYVGKIEMPMWVIVSVLERTDAFVRDREAWTTLFAVIEMARERPVELDWDFVVRAAKTIPDNDPISSDMVFKTAVLRAPPSKTVTIQRR